MNRIKELDKHFKPCGSCWFCGFHDKRHRLWDTMIGMHEGGDSIELIASVYELPIEAVAKVIELKPYQ